MTNEPLRIAMWSGPRNISTAMMRSFENRSDTVVVDEPLYAYYLAKTEIKHPMNDQILASQSNDWQQILKEISGPLPDGKTVFYQKHMTHHLLSEIDRGWLKSCFNAFLIRDPRAIVASYAAKRDEVTLDDIGIIQEAEIFDYVCDLTGEAPPVLEANDVLTDPASVLSKLCERAGISFSTTMLEWPKGKRDTDGIWAEHWYHSVENSTGFGGPKPKTNTLQNAELERLAELSLPAYERMAKHRLLPE
jgi:hypothetical protein